MWDLLYGITLGKGSIPWGLTAKGLEVSCLKKNWVKAPEGQGAHRRPNTYPPSEYNQVLVNREDIY